MGICPVAFSQNNSVNIAVWNDGDLTATAMQGTAGVVGTQYASITFAPVNTLQNGDTQFSINVSFSVINSSGFLVPTGNATIGHAIGDPSAVAYYVCAFGFKGKFFNYDAMAAFSVKAPPAKRPRKLVFDDTDDEFDIVIMSPDLDEDHDLLTD